MNMRFPLVIVVALCVGAACVSESSAAFKKSNRGLVPAKGAVIFLPGQYTGLESQLAETITRKAKTIGPLQVVPYAEYKDRLNLSLAVANRDASLQLDKSGASSPKIDTAKVKELFDRFETPYLYIIWISQHFKGSTAEGVSATTVLGRLYGRDHPEKSIGYTEFVPAGGWHAFFNNYYGRSVSNEREAAAVLGEAAEAIIESMRKELTGP